MQNSTDYTNALIALQSSITEALAHIATHNLVTDDWEVKTEALHEADPNLLADAAEAAEERVTTLAELEVRYRNITRALHKITEGTYGVCEISGEPIEQARLSANPAARTCIAHKDQESHLPL